MENQEKTTKTRKPRAPKQEVPAVAAPMEGAAEGTVMQATVPEYENKVLVVIPYLASAAQGRELEFAVAGWRKHFKENFLIVVVGDYHKVCSTGDDIFFIPCPRRLSKVSTLLILTTQTSSRRCTKYSIRKRDLSTPVMTFMPSTTSTSTM